MQTLKQRARQVVSNALKAGTLTKPAHCACGHARVEAHHTDYIKPLDVEWSCSKCHKAKHPEMFAPTHCPQGHPYAGDNLRVVTLKDGYARRRCKRCDRLACREYWKTYSRKVYH